MTATLLPANPASPAQVNFINSLRTQRALATLTEAEATQLDKRGASREIDRLKALPVVVAAARADAPSLFDGVPTSKYSIVENGVRTFWEVKTFRGTTYLRLLVGAPGDFQRVRVELPRVTRVVRQIKDEGVLVAAQAFATHYTCCAVCGADLSDETSVALGLGPICRRRFGL